MVGQNGPGLLMHVWGVVGGAGDHHGSIQLWNHKQVIAAISCRSIGGDVFPIDFKLVDPPQIAITHLSVFVDHGTLFEGFGNPFGWNDLLVLVVAI